VCFPGGFSGSGKIEGKTLCHNIEENSEVIRRKLRTLQSGGRSVGARWSLGVTINPFGHARKTVPRRGAKCVSGKAQGNWGY